MRGHDRSGFLEVDTKIIGLDNSAQQDVGIFLSKYSPNARRGRRWHLIERYLGQRLPARVCPAPTLPMTTRPRTDAASKRNALFPVSQSKVSANHTVRPSSYKWSAVAFDVLTPQYLEHH